MKPEGTGHLDVRPLALDDLPKLKRLFSSDRSAQSCWCMWFIIRVKEYHAGGAAVNAEKFKALAMRSAHPLGVVAYDDGRPVGWAAVGQRSRYERAVKTPTLKSVDQSENDRVWLVPCFFVRPDRRGGGIARRLLEHAVGIARSAGASAVEGFPTAGAKVGSAESAGGHRADVRIMRLPRRQPPVIEPGRDADGFACFLIVVLLQC